MSRRIVIQQRATAIQPTRSQSIRFPSNRLCVGYNFISFINFKKMSQCRQQTASNNTRQTILRHGEITHSKFPQWLSLKNSNRILLQQIRRSSSFIRLHNGRSPLARAGIDEPIAHNRWRRTVYFGKAGYALIVGVGIGPIIDEPLIHDLCEVLLVVYFGSGAVEMIFWSIVVCGCLFGEVEMIVWSCSIMILVGMGLGGKRCLCWMMLEVLCHGN